MSELEMTRLRGHEALTAPAFRGVGGVLFGLAFVAAGTVIVLISLGVLPAERSARVPDSVIALVGMFFLLPGLWVVFYSLREGRRIARAREIMQMRPGEPWAADYAWNPEGVEDGSLRKVANKFLFAMIMIVFLIPFNYIGFIHEGGSTFFAVFAGLFDLLALVALGSAVYHLFRHLKYGQSTLRFGRFPFFLGEKLNVEFNPRKLAGAREIDFTLRCVQERYETTGRGRNRRTETVCYEIYRDERKLTDLDPMLRMQPAQEIEFDLPDGGEEMECRLGDRPPRYWELEVKAETPGVDYSATFLLPVYRRPA